ncbi:hypothetical protein M413DRAFT_379087 [Hebeloma cylindrosporum]|uniref:Uncharacterized protein n=1 Tax=Hebeloma cylindrosporum TaxID=76867 RepID=A0A0C2YTI4_HEBCY|nr:hypothetical protein M413DRAFT_379087 [Hebeloma cylindrosporum h7]
MTITLKSTNSGCDTLGASDYHERPHQGSMEVAPSVSVIKDIATSGSKISSLPQEILESILDTAQEEANCAYPNDLTKSSVYLTASQVSKFWRSVAINNPLWWTYLLIFPPWKFDAIATYLKRSKACPIDMHISIHPDYWYISRKSTTTLPSLSGFGALADIISPHFHRCRSLRVQGIFFQSYNSSIDLLRHLENVEMPYLEEFTFDGEFSFRGPTPIIDRRIHLFSAAPMLRDLRTGGTALKVFTPSLSSVTTLHLSRVIDKGFIGFPELGRMLEACTLLTFFAIYDDFLNEWAGVSASCHVPLLEKLHIFGNMLSVSELILFLDAPKLQELVIAPIVAADVSLLLTHSTPQRFRFPLLTSLTLALAYPDAFNVLPIASTCFPRVELLAVSSAYFDDFYRVFTTENFIVYPNLRSIAITGVDRPLAEILHDVATFRQKHKVPFRKIIVDATSLEVLRSTGFDWYGAELVEGEVWERQRKAALYSHMPDLFVGSPYDDSDEN